MTTIVETTLAHPALAGSAALKARPRAGAPMQAFVRHLDAAKAKPVDLAPRRSAEGPSRPERTAPDPRPADRIDYAKRYVGGAMKHLETNIGKALHRLGFGRAEIKRVTHQVMDSVKERVAAATDKLDEAKHPIRAAHQIVDKAIDAVGHGLARTLHGMGFERPVIAKVVYHVSNGLDRA